MVWSSEPLSPMKPVGWWAIPPNPNKVIQTKSWLNSPFYLLTPCMLATALAFSPSVVSQRVIQAPIEHAAAHVFSFNCSRQVYVCFNKSKRPSDANVLHNFNLSFLFIFFGKIRYSFEIWSSIKCDILFCLSLRTMCNC